MLLGGGAFLANRLDRPAGGLLGLLGIPAGLFGRVVCLLRRIYLLLGATEALLGLGANGIEFALLAFEPSMLGLQLIDPALLLGHGGGGAQRMILGLT